MFSGYPVHIEGSFVIDHYCHSCYLLFPLNFQISVHSMLDHDHDQRLFITYIIFYYLIECLCHLHVEPNVSNWYMILTFLDTNPYNNFSFYMKYITFQISKLMLISIYDLIYIGQFVLKCSIPISISICK